MHKKVIKLLGALTILLLIVMTPIMVLATNEGVSVVNTQTNEYIIYIKDYTDKNFKYAFTNNASPKEMDLSYINSISDLGGSQGAFLDAETYEKLKNQPIYIWAKDEEENLILNGVQIDFENSLTKENINTIENTTKRIAVEISTSKDSTELTTPVRSEIIEGVKEVAKAGYVKITDSKDAEYYYQRVKTSDSEEYAKLMELAEDINSKYSEMDMYEKVQANEQFYSLYSKLTNEAKWQKVENMEIKQPESIEQSNGTGDKYIVFLKKIAKSGDTTLDAQFLQEYYDYEPNAVIERVETQETTKLPITYDSIALIVILALVVIALVVIFIRMKKLNKKNEEK